MWVYDLLVIFLSIVMAYIPILIYAAFVWWLDRYDREPVVIIAIAFMWGAVGSVVISLMFELILGQPLYLFYESEEEIYALSSITIGPGVEELPDT